MQTKELWQKLRYGSPRPLVIDSPPPVDQVLRELETQFGSECPRSFVLSEGPLALIPGKFGVGVTFSGIKGLLLPIPDLVFTDRLAAYQYACQLNTRSPYSIKEQIIAEVSSRYTEGLPALVSSAISLIYATQSKGSLVGLGVTHSEQKGVRYGLINLNDDSAVPQPLFPLDECRTENVFEAQRNVRIFNRAMGLNELQVVEVERRLQEFSSEWLPPLLASWRLHSDCAPLGVSTKSADEERAGLRKGRFRVIK